MLIVNTETIVGKEIVEVLGMAQRSTIRAKHMGKDIMSGFRQLVGGEMTEYREMLEEARQIALDRMIAQAKDMNADAVVNVRFSTSAIMQGAAEILAYGTAVKLR
ncbi:MAG: YbjQ family protein [Tissierellales bacterium]|jgi:uncharacterized protein YbjQ (UPF0145 family)|nr:YbjQ family protein [Tissierellales bacterium]